VVLLAILAGCSRSPPGVSSAESESQRAAQMDQEVEDCLNAWLNTEAPQRILDDGIAWGAVTVDSESGRYAVHSEGEPFIRWTNSDSVPWSVIRTSIFQGQGCPYSGVGVG